MLITSIYNKIISLQIFSCCSAQCTIDTKHSHVRPLTPHSSLHWHSHDITWLTPNFWKITQTLSVGKLAYYCVLTHRAASSATLAALQQLTSSLYRLVRVTTLSQLGCSRRDTRRVVIRFLIHDNTYENRSPVTGNWSLQRTILFQTAYFWTWYEPVSPSIFDAYSCQKYFTQSSDVQSTKYSCGFYFWKFFTFCCKIFYDNFCNIFLRSQASTDCSISTIRALLNIRNIAWKISYDNC